MPGTRVSAHHPGRVIRVSSSGSVGAVVNVELAPSHDVPLGHPARPLWRGRLHVYALIAAVPALAALLSIASGTRARIAVAIYAAGLLSMFAASATYHRWVHTLRARDLWRRVDHALIFAAIAGGMTPVSLLTVPDRWGVPLLSLTWAGGIFGMIMKILGWRHQRIAGGILYIGLGWLGVVAIPYLWSHAGVVAALLLFAGGAFYTVGAIGLYRRWPTLRPAVFSYHEVWHAFTVAAAASQLAAIWIIVG